jgi:hypothetical protein
MQNEKDSGPLWEVGVPGVRRVFCCWALAGIWKKQVLTGFAGMTNVLEGAGVLAALIRSGTICTQED